MKFGYLVDVADIKLDETTNCSWIQAMPAGKYYHPLHGEIDLNADRTKRFADNVKNNVRGQDLDIDYDHKERENTAAGWVKAAESRNDGSLWLNVEWTKRAAEHIKNKEYRYFSPEFQDEWEHPVTKQKHSDVLFGGALTNRPFLKGIMPVNLSEYFSEPADEGSTSMTPEQKAALIAKHGLAADATDDQILQAATDATLAPPANVPPENAQLSEITKTLNELKAQADKNPLAATMIKLMENQQAEMVKLQEQSERNAVALRLAETNNLVVQLNEKAKAAGFGVPIPQLESLAKTLSEGGVTKQLSESIVGTVTGILDAKLVQLGEIRPGGLPGGTNDAVKQFTEAVNKEVNDNKLSYADATEKVANDNPQMYAEYRKSSYANDGGE